MGISIFEFRAAMMTLGAKQLPDIPGTRYSFLVPCFQIGATVFLHSGSYYIVQRERKVPQDMLDRAMEKFGEKHPGGKNFWDGEIHSVKGILTLGTMIQERYSKELVDQLANETYKMLFEKSEVKNKVELPTRCETSQKMAELCEVIAKYDQIVNPYSNHQLKMKEPIGYFDKVQIHMANEKECEFECKSAYTRFKADDYGWSFVSKVDTYASAPDKGGYIFISHYYYNRNGGHSVNEVIQVEYRSINTWDADPRAVKLTISLKTGMAWIINVKKEPVTDEQIDTAIKLLKVCSNRLKRRMIRKMVCTKA